MRSFATSKLATRSVIALSSSFGSLARRLAARQALGDRRQRPPLAVDPRRLARLGRRVRARVNLHRGRKRVRPPVPEPARQPPEQAGAGEERGAGNPPPALAAGRSRHQRQGHCTAPPIPYPRGTAAALLLVIAQFAMRRRSTPLCDHRGRVCRRRTARSRTRYSDNGPAQGRRSDLGPRIEPAGADRCRRPTRPIRPKSLS